MANLPLIKNYGPTIFTLLTMAVLIYFAIKPTVETILVLQKELADSEAVLQKAITKATNLSQGSKNYNEMDQTIKEKITTAVPDTVTIKTMTQNLEQTAAAHEASISALQIQPIVITTKNEDQIGSLTEISFTFNTEGSYNNLVALLHDIKTSGRLFSFDNMSLSKTNDGSALIMSLSGKAYFLK